MKSKRQVKRKLGHVMLNLSTERALTRVSGCVKKFVPRGSSPFKTRKGDWAELSFAKMSGIVTRDK